MTDVFPRRRAAAVFVGAAALALFAPVVAHAQLRVATWNISNYGDTTQTGTGNRSAALKTAIYGTFENRSMAPDVFMTQEFLSDAASSNFLTVLNTAPNSPGDWARASFVNGNDTDSAFFYRTSKVNFVADVTVVTGADGAAPPRDVHRYDVTLKGYSATVAPALSLYGVHMKAGDSGSGPSGDEGRRETEANAIRANAASLPAGRQFLVGGDFNTPGSSDAGYARLVESRANNACRFADPISPPGACKDNNAFRYGHTHDASAEAGMDDRYDLVLLGKGLTDGKGFDYVGNPNQPYSTSTWNDPNHSYRAWGNDGESFNNPIRTTANTMVGPAIAQALIDASATNGGHLPGFLDLRTATELAASTTTVGVGSVQQGSDATASFDDFNDVNASIWGAGGIAELLYSMQASSAFPVPDGFFTDLAGGGVNGHLVTLDTSTMGLKTGTLSLFDDGVLARTIALQANVVPEPAGVALIGIGMLALAGRRRRR